jgi:hypothetical protein
MCARMRLTDEPTEVFLNADNTFLVEVRTPS